MKKVRIPKAVLAAEIGAGRVTLMGMGGSAATGALGRAAEAIAATGLEKAAKDPGGTRLQFPPCCCNCLSGAGRVRPVESTSIVNLGVAYVFRFAIPHCAACSDTANRKRPGLMGLIAAFLVISLPIGIAILAAGAALNRDGLVYAALLVGPLAGVVLPQAWMMALRPRRGQASRYQSVYVSSLDTGFAGLPNSCTMTFENSAYGSRFVALNRDAGVAGV
jgi:hypothetical protein